jgi:hypothetical protein
MEETMKNETKKGLEALDLSEEMEQEFFTRCFSTVDYLNAIATDIIMDFIDNASGPLSRQVLRNSPEVIAVKAFQKAIHSLNIILSDEL